MIDLARESARLLAFAERSRHPDGGFAWLRADGTPDLARPRELWITTRMTHVFALADLLGHAGARELVDHGLRSLREDFRDPVHGGWFAQAPADSRAPLRAGASSRAAAGSEGASLPAAATEKRAYEHVFVVLAAASAGADELLHEALDVLERRFWDEAAGALVDVWSRDWTWLEPYRGANANMHGVEALLATGDPRWRERAARMVQRFVVANDPRIVEHFDAEWRPLPDYNRDDPAHPFRPFGATIGHWFEWARLAFTLDGERFGAAARRLFAAAVREGWDGAGFVYTVDWDGRPVVRDHLHWVLCEAIGAAAVLGEDALQRQWWDLAERVFIDRDGGSWWHQLDAANRPSFTVWDGKPDVYHAFQATLLPRVPLAPSLAAALRA